MKAWLPCLLGVLLVAAPSVASAQVLDLGYQYLRASQSGSDGENYPVGFGATVGFPIKVTKAISGIAFGDWSHKDRSRTGVNAGTYLIGYGGGVRWMPAKAMTATPAIDVGVGGVYFHDVFHGTGISRIESETNPAVTAGASVAVKVHKSASVVGHVDYRRVFVEDNPVNVVRALVGIRVPMK